MGDDIEARLGRVRARVAAAAARAGRGVDEVTLVAVSKRKPTEAIVDALAAGCTDFGENYVQELQAKAAELATQANLRWHFVGHLQRNKARHVLAIPALAMIHGVDSAALVAELERRAAAASRTVEALVQVNVAGEASKRGCPPDGLEALLDSAADCEHLVIVGLMTMPPIGPPEQGRPHFQALRALRDAHGGSTRLPELSMGMSHDFEVAIEEGATLIRVGTAIFGERTQ